MEHRANIEEVVSYTKRRADQIKGLGEFKRYFDLGLENRYEDIARGIGSLNKSPVESFDCKYTVSEDRYSAHIPICNSNKDWACLIKDWVMNGRRTFDIAGFVVEKDSTEVRFRSLYMYHPRLNSLWMYLTQVEDGLWELGVGYGRNVLFTAVKKLTKMLKYMGYEDKEVVKFAAEFSNRREGYVIDFTDTYIPENYMLMAEYQNLSSCMSHSSDEYGLEDDEHPTLAYEGSKNLLLGLVRNVNDDSDHPYVARFIFNKDSGYISHTYGMERVCNYIQSNYSVGNIRGGELTKIKSKSGGYLLPYIDGSYRGCSDLGDIFVIDDGPIYGEYDTGRWGGVRCDNCGNTCDEEDNLRALSDSYDDVPHNICGDCSSTDYTWSTHHDLYIYNSYAVSLHDGTIVHGGVSEFCDHTGERYLKEEMVWYNNRRVWSGCVGELEDGIGEEKPKDDAPKVYTVDLKKVVEYKDGEWQVLVGDYLMRDLERPYFVEKL